MNERKAFLDFCDMVRNTEKDKDRFLNAAHLQRIEKASTFTAGQMVGVIVLLSILILGSVAMVCLTLSGNAGCIPLVLGAILFAIFITSAVIIAG